ncbi:MAG: hypothetical protein P8J87_00950 [Verrucomicrobiales bacterium]|nr:hypothetical protein [Verrucomicrobiales bacterium]
MKRVNVDELEALTWESRGGAGDAFLFKPGEEHQLRHPAEGAGRILYYSWWRATRWGSLALPG